MLVIETINALSQHLDLAKSKGQIIGFVPTMGALHPGHIDLVRRAAAQTDLVVVSIFVNPTQFNNPDDLSKYPKTLEADLDLLRSVAHVVFVPQVSEMYGDVVSKHWNFNRLTTTLEGHFRPGHFDGVCTIVQKLFDAVGPDFAFFGKKDFQQLAVIRALVDFEKIPVQIVPCDTVREADGLAMSSRNTRLSSTQRQQALVIYNTLMGIKARQHELDLTELLAWGRSQFNSSSGIRLEYLEIVDASDFVPIGIPQNGQYGVILIAAYAGEVRLIDNMEIHW